VFYVATSWFSSIVNRRFGTKAICHCLREVGIDIFEPPNVSPDEPPSSTETALPAGNRQTEACIATPNFPRHEALDMLKDYAIKSMDVLPYSRPRRLSLMATEEAVRLFACFATK